MLVQPVTQDGDKWKPEGNEQYILTPTAITRYPLSTSSVPFTYPGQYIAPGTYMSPYPQGLQYSTRSHNPWEFDMNISSNAREERRVYKHFHYKFLDKWIYEDFPEFFEYIVVESGKPRLVRSQKERKENIGKQDSSDNLERKIDFIEEEFFNMNTSRSILKKLMRNENINWYELEYEQKLIKYAFADYLRNKMIKNIQYS